SPKTWVERAIRIEAGGYARSFSTSYDFAAARFNPDGSLDPSFGGDGVVTTSIGGSFDAEYGQDGVVQTDGKVLVTGYWMHSGDDDFELVRYNVDGSLDVSFSDDGIATTSISLYDIANAIALQADGKIVVAGSSSEGVTVARYYAATPIQTS